MTKRKLDNIVEVLGGGVALRLAGVIGIAAAVGICSGTTGCKQEKERLNIAIEGIVVREYGNVAQFFESDDTASEILDLENPVYILMVDSIGEQGYYHDPIDNSTYRLADRYLIQIDETYGRSGPHTIYNLAAVIEEGTRIRFWLRWGGEDLISFYDSIGLVNPDNIIILD